MKATWIAVYILTACLLHVDAQNECDSSPCANNAPCRDGPFGYYTCECTTAGNIGYQRLNCDEQATATPCPSGNVFEYVAEITSPGWPGQIPHRELCYNLIFIHGATTINITFLNFSMEANKDILEVGVGTFIDLSNVTQYDDSPELMPPPVLTLPGPYVYLLTSTDRTIFSDGYRLQISADGDDCITMPCQNGATCVDLIRDYMCICDTGFEGRNCTIDTDECRSDPCMNGGTCNDMNNFYTCSCTPSYTGTNCETGVVIVSSTSPSVLPGFEVREGETTQSIDFDLTITPSTLATYSVGGAGTSGLWQISVYFSPNSNGLGTLIGGQTLTTLNAAQQTALWDPPSSTTITNLQAPALTVPSNTLCSQLQYFCAMIERGTNPTPVFELRGDPGLTAQTGCTQVTCRGVEITSTSLSVSPGEVSEGTSETVTLGVTLNSDANGGSVSGSDLWQITAFLSADANGVTRFLSTNPTLSAAQGATGINAGTPATIGGVSVNFDLGNGPTCSQFSHVCVQVQRGSNPSVDFSLTGVPDSSSLIACQSLTCRGVEITSTSLSVSPGEVSEGTLETVTLGVTLNSNANGGSVSGSDLWLITSFLSADANGGGTRLLSTNPTLSNAQRATSIIAGTPATIDAVSVNFNLQGGPTCSQFSHVCVQVQRGSNPSVDFSLTGIPDANSLVTCQPITCRGVEITSTSLSGSPGEVSEGTSETLTLSVTLNSDANAGSVSGSDLWLITAFLSADANGGGTRYLSTNSTLSVAQRGTSIIAGSPETIGGVSVNFDLGSGPTCSQFSHVCVQVQRGPNPSPDFFLNAVPDSNSLIGCQSIMCRGVEITSTSLTVSPGQLSEGTSETLTLGVTLNSDANAGSVSGSDLWQITAFLSADANGATRFLSTNPTLSVAQRGIGIIAGTPTTINNVSVDFDLGSGLTCSQFSHVCVQVQRGPNPSPDFFLNAVPDSDSLIGCQAITCRGVEITSTSLSVSPGEVSEGTLETVTLGVTLNSNSSGGSVSGSNLWLITAFLSADANGGGTRFLSTNATLSAAQRGTGIIAGTPATIGGVSVDFDLRSGPTCSQFSHVCVQVQRGFNPSPDFSLTGVPDSSSLIACQSLTCGGVEITGTGLSITSGQLQEGTSSNTLNFDVSLDSSASGGSISGSNLWMITAWASPNSDGSDPRFQSGSVSLQPSQSSVPINAGDTANINGLSVTWDLQNGPLCSQIGYLCVRVDKGANANPDFQLTGVPSVSVLTTCQEVTCRGVEVTGTSLSISSGPILEGASQNVNFSVSINSNANGGGVSGTNLWELDIYTSSNADGSGQRLVDETVQLTASQAGSAISPGVITTINDLRSMFNLQGGPTCSQFSYVCVTLRKATGSNPDFGLMGVPDDSVLTSCQQIDCTGVQIVGTTLGITSGDIQEGTIQPVTFNIDLQASATSGDVSGTNLWMVTAFGSQNPNGLGARVDPQNVPLAQSQGQTAIIAGQSVQLSGVSFNWDLTNGPRCSEFTYFCVQVERNDNPSVDFLLSGVPDDNVLTTCQAVTCRGVEITNTALSITSGNILEGTLQNVSLGVTLQSDSQGGSVNGDNLWQITAFASANSDGTGRQEIATISLSGAQAGTDITAGNPAQITGLTYPLDLRGGITCSQFQYVCIQVDQGTNPNPTFLLNSAPQNLIDCQQITCRGVEITDTSLTVTSGELREGVVGQPVQFNVALSSNAMGGSLSGTNLWQFRAYGSQNADGSGPSVLEGPVSLTLAQGSTPLTAGVDTAFNGLSVQWNVINMVTCPDVQYLCVEASKNSAANPDYLLTVSSADVLRDCQPLTCRGVEISGTSINVASGDTLVENSPSHAINFNLNIDSVPNSGQLSGSGLWSVSVYASDSGTPGGAVLSPVTNLALTAAQANTGITAGVQSTLSSLTGNLNLDGLLCSDLGGICATLSKNDTSANPDFTLDPQPDSSVLTSCVPGSCTGVQVNGITYNVVSGAPIMAGSPTNDVTLNVNIGSNPGGAGVSGSNLWQVELFINTQVDGQGTTLLSQVTNIPTASNSQPLTAGIPLTLNDVSTQLNLFGQQCTDILFVCIRLSRNGGASPQFTLSETSSSALISCQALPCQDTNECNPNPCQNGGSCTDGINSYSCSCLPGYTGVNCSTEINECSSMPCQNGATCNDLVNAFMCVCAPGYTGTFCNQDINECNPNPCQNGGVCNNLLNAYRCDCQPGYTDVNCQTNIDECASTPCMNGGTCTDQVNGYFCQCAPGWAGVECGTNIDECESFPCRNGGTCTDAINGFTCDCAPGWTGTVCGTDIDECASSPCVNGQCDDGIDFYFCTCAAGYTGINCDINIDECMSDPCFNGGTCNDLINGYTCMCAPGWTDVNCQADIDECASGPCMNEGTCNNLQNMYTCTCAPGYTGTRCGTDINECASGPCMNGGTCTDEVNQFTCQCADGWTGLTCEIPVNECSSAPCANGGTCIDETNGFRCMCAPGWTGTLCGIDIDECASGPCQNGGTCTDGINIYVCECVDGWRGFNCDTERMECNSDPCQNNGTCFDNINGYTCNCVPGFTGTHCDIDINECASDPCQNGASCLNEVNQYTCDCAPGYEGTNCQFDINECNSGPCQNGGTCDDRVALYVCTCLPGWTGTNCDVDINECSSSPCINGGSCSHAINSYTCSCAAGYTGVNCEFNIDECSSSPCMNGGTCTDGVNQYVCSCRSGFTGLRCQTDIDECDSSPCLNAGTCIDNINAYSCLCADGYAGINCGMDIDECASGPCLNGGTCRDMVNGYTCTCVSGREGTRCELDTNECASGPCQNGGSCFDQFDGYTCQCVPGYTGPTCGVDFDECSSNPCVFGSCTQTIDFYSCQCQPGYEGVNCQIDINECASNPCRNGGSCMDMVNGYSCMCQPGWTGSNCEINIDECLITQCVNGMCIDGINSILCICSPGWTGAACNTDIDECASGPCDNGGTCINEVNRYRCQCAPGWTGYNCDVDVNECGINPCHNGATCNNLQNAFSCTCAPGWTGNDCTIDINECESGPCLNGGSCLNGRNQFTCECTSAWTGVTCDTPIDECLSSPCQNGGTCVDDVNRYVCSCPGGWSGVHCEIPINECNSNPCVNGLCFDEVNSFRCLCNAGWTGELCNIDIVDCRSDSCLNGGSCIEGIGRFTCNCAPGWTDARCDVDIQECASDPCQNGATCVDLINGFTCTCATGYTGNLCETDIDECNSQPCRNGGNCYNEPDNMSYRCACRPGYTGTNCEIDINECMPDPCVNGGICMDEVNAFRCECPPGYAGTTCSIDVDECASSPCMNGGICQDEVNGYSCTCRRGFTGPNCQIDNDECASSPCQNGASCVNRENMHGFDCVCATGFSGILCEINDDDCASSPCLNGGICRDGVNMYTCTCAQGWSGTNCQIAIGCRVNYTLGVGERVIINSPNYPSNYRDGENCLWFIMGINGREVFIDFKDYITENRYDILRVGVESTPNIGSQRLQASGPLLPADTSIRANAIWLSFQSDNEKTERGFSIEIRDSAYRVLTPCDAQPCINGGTCNNVGTTQFQCACTTSWEGTNCELPTEFNRCGLNPCSNGAECINNGRDYTCMCPSGYTGKNCTQEVDECASNPCQNNGTCYDLINGYTCVCVDCYSGINCQVAPPADECTTNLCLNGGTCSFINGAHQCACLAGYYGDYCEMDGDRCRGNPCINGECTTVGDTFSCACPDNYIGTQCNIPVTTECAIANPCQNGASCFYDNGTYSCSCPAGYVGDFCETEVDNCAGIDCSGNGVCENQFGSFQCRCRSGFSGTTCQDDINECLSSPCQNGGVCQDQINSFTCTCPSGYLLPLCTPVTDLSNPGNALFTFQGTEVGLNPWIVLLVVALGLIAIFFFILFVIVCICGRSTSDIYDAEKAKEERARGDYNSQLRGDIPMLSDVDRPATRDNNYGFVPPQSGGGSAVAAVNSYENPWPETNDELRKTQL